MVIIFASIMIMFRNANFTEHLVKFIITISLEYLECSYTIRIN
jgi:hypothetical protein